MVCKDVYVLYETNKVGGSAINSAINSKQLGSVMANAAVCKQYHVLQSQILNSVFFAAPVRVYFQ